MTGAGHRLSGFICAGSAFGYGLRHTAISLPEIAITAVGLYLGATAPDWLERPLGRWRLVPHRTITHWWLVWGMLCAGAFFWLNASLTVLIVSFSVGALVHITGDAITPMGVPWFNPVRQTRVGFASSSKAQELSWLLGVALLAGAPWLWAINTVGV